MIEIKHLHLIREIAGTGSITKASGKLFLTQPSLSHQLKEIESRLGVQLFLRVNKKMVLTPGGRIILDAANEILPVLDHIEKQLTAKGPHQMNLRISTKCYTCYHWLPAVIKKFQHRFPEAEIEIVTEAMNEPVDFLLAGKIDIALLNYKTAERGIRTDKLFDDEQVLLVNEDHPLAAKQFVGLRDFKDQHLVIYKEPWESDNFAHSMLIPAGVVPGKVTKMQLTEARVELVKAGMGITVLSKWLVKPFIHGGSKLRMLRITKNGYYRSWYVSMLTQKYNDIYISNFIDFLKGQDLGSGTSK